MLSAQPGRIRSVNNAETFELIRVIPGGRRGTRGTCAMSVPDPRADAGYGTHNR